MNISSLKENSLLQGGKYRIVKVLGQGGFGITYLATQELLDRKVCVKEFFFKEYCERDESTSHVTLGTQSNHELVERFMGKFIKEARTISQLEHPNIIRIHDIFKENNTAYYVMEYIDGDSLSEKVNHSGCLSEPEAVGYVKQVASALDFIHQRNINHLDIKPANIMVRRSDSKAILIDFGLSKQYDAQGGQTSTTPVGISHGYAPLEQYNVGGVSAFSPQTDIYSLGATLYKLVTGNTPPQAGEVLNEGLPELPNALSGGIKNAIHHAMEVRKKDRPKDIKAFVKLMDAAVTVDCDTELNTPVIQPNVKEDDVTVMLNQSGTNGSAPQLQDEEEKSIPTTSSEPIEKEVRNKNLKLDFHLGNVCLSTIMILVFVFNQYWVGDLLGLAYSDVELIVIPVLISLALWCIVSFIYSTKRLKQYNEENGKIQYPIISYLYISLNVLTLGLSFFLARQYGYTYADGISLGIMLIPLGTIQLLMWEKWGIWTVLLGVLSLAFCGVIAPGYVFVFWGQIFFYLLCQVLLLCTSKNGVNSWKQLKYGSSFKKHKLLYFYFVILLLINVIQLGVLYYF